MNRHSHSHAAGPGDPSNGPVVPTRPSPVRETLGIEYLAVETGRLRARFRPGPEFTNANGMVQGGILCAFLDHVMGQSCFSVVRPDDRLTTVEISLRFLEGARPGILTGEGRVVKRGNQVVFAEGDIQDAGGRTVVRGFTSLLIGPAPK